MSPSKDSASHQQLSCWQGGRIGESGSDLGNGIALAVLAAHFLASRKTGFRWVVVVALLLLLFPLLRLPAGF